MILRRLPPPKSVLPPPFMTLDQPGSSSDIAPSLGWRSSSSFTESNVGFVLDTAVDPTVQRSTVLSSSASSSWPFQKPPVRRNAKLEVEKKPRIQPYKKKWSQKDLQKAWNQKIEIMTLIFWGEMWHPFRKRRCFPPEAHAKMALLTDPEFGNFTKTTGFLHALLEEKLV